MSQKDYIKGGNRLVNPPTSSVSTSLRRVLSILLHHPGAPIPPPSPPYNPFCYLPTGSYIGPNVWTVCQQQTNERIQKGYVTSSSLSLDPEVPAMSVLP